MFSDLRVVCHLSFWVLCTTLQSRLVRNSSCIIWLTQPPCLRLGTRLLASSVVDSLRKPGFPNWATDKFVMWSKCPSLTPRASIWLSPTLQTVTQWSQLFPDWQVGLHECHLEAQTSFSDQCTCTQDGHFKRPVPDPGLRVFGQRITSYDWRPVLEATAECVTKRKPSARSSSSSWMVSSSPRGLSADPPKSHGSLVTSRGFWPRDNPHSSVVLPFSGNSTRTRLPAPSSRQQLFAASKLPEAATRSSTWYTTAMQLSGYKSKGQYH